MTTRSDPQTTASLPPALRRIALAAILLWAAVLRLDSLNTPGLWLDEILGVRRTSSIPVLWIHRTEGPDPEHGPLYHGLLRAAGSIEPSERLYRFPSAVAGVATVGVLSVIGTMVGGPGTGLLAAAIAAVAPVHVYYSREAKPYALLLLLFVVGLWAVLRLAAGGAAARPVARNVLLVVLLLLLLTSSHGLFYGATLFLTLLAVMVRRPHPPFREWLAWGMAGVGVVVVFLLLYASLLVLDTIPLGAPALSVDVVARLVQGLISGLPESRPATPAVWVLGVAAVLGAWWIWTRRPDTAPEVIVAAVAGLGLPVAALMLADHWISLRYVLLAFPGLVVLAAGAGSLGVHAAARLTPSRPRWLAGTVSGGLVLAMCAGAACAAWRPTEMALAAKADWRHVAGELARRVKPGDLVLASNGWTYECLAYHLPRVGASVRLESAGESIERAEVAVRSAGSAFLVAGGFHADTRIRSWMDRAHALFGFDAEVIRAYYYPSLQAYLGERVTSEEQAGHARRLWRDLSGQVLLEGEPFLVDGWGDLERGADGGAFRWSTGTRSRIYLPVIESRPATLTINASPYGPVADGQSITISVDGRPLARVPVNPERHMYDIDVQGVEWTSGTHFVEFAYAATAAPSVVQPPSTDTRELAVVFRSIRFR